MNGAQMIWESLAWEGVEVIFGYPGAASILLYDALSQYPQMRHVLVRHEQGAAHAADGYARATGKVGVCTATSGPGATNLVTGIATAFADSVPLMVITVQVARSAIGRDAFQEVDITGITLPITKESHLVLDIESLPRIIKEGFHLARTGRPRPVLIDISKDVLAEDADYVYPEVLELPGYQPTLAGHPAQIKRAAKLVNEAARPLLIAGRGVSIARADAELRRLAERAAIPVATTLLGSGGFPENHPLNGGWWGTPSVSEALAAADLVIAVGTRLDGHLPGKIIHVDIDPAEIGRSLKADVPIVGDARQVLGALSKVVAEGNHRDWLKNIEKWRGGMSQAEMKAGGALGAPEVMRRLYEVTGDAAVITTGLGQHPDWVPSGGNDQRGCLIASGELATPGFALPAAIGAKIGRPQDTVWSIDSDTGFRATMREMGTITQEGLAVKMAVLNSGQNPGGPDFVKLAAAYDVPGRRVESGEGVVPALTQALAEYGPFLIDFAVTAD